MTFQKLGSESREWSRGACQPTDALSVLDSVRKFPDAGEVEKLLRSSGESSPTLCGKVLTTPGSGHRCPLSPRAAVSRPRTRLRQTQRKMPCWALSTGWSILVKEERCGGSGTSRWREASLGLSWVLRPLNPPPEGMQAAPPQAQPRRGPRPVLLPGTLRTKRKT